VVLYQELQAGDVSNRKSRHQTGSKAKGKVALSPVIATGAGAAAKAKGRGSGRRVAARGPKRVPLNISTAADGSGKRTVVSKSAARTAMRAAKPAAAAAAQAGAAAAAVEDDDAERVEPTEADSGETTAEQDAPREVFPLFRGPDARQAAQQTAKWKAAVIDLNKLRTADLNRISQAAESSLTALRREEVRVAAEVKSSVQKREAAESKAVGKAKQAVPPVKGSTAEASKKVTAPVPVPVPVPQTKDVTVPPSAPGAKKAESKPVQVKFCVVASRPLTDAERALRTAAKTSYGNLNRSALELEVFTKMSEHDKKVELVWVVGYENHIARDELPPHYRPTLSRSMLNDNLGSRSDELAFELRRHAAAKLATAKREDEDAELVEAAAALAAVAHLSKTDAAGEEELLLSTFVPNSSAAESLTPVTPTHQSQKSQLPVLPIAATPKRSAVRTPRHTTPPPNRKSAPGTPVVVGKTQSPTPKASVMLKRGEQHAALDALKRNRLAEDLFCGANQVSITKAAAEVHENAYAPMPFFNGKRWCHLNTVAQVLRAAGVDFIPSLVLRGLMGFDESLEYSIRASFDKVVQHFPAMTAHAIRAAVCPSAHGGHIASVCSPFIHDGTSNTLSLADFRCSSQLPGLCKKFCFVPFDVGTIKVGLDFDTDEGDSAVVIAVHMRLSEDVGHWVAISRYNGEWVVTDDNKDKRSLTRNDWSDPGSPFHHSHWGGALIRWSAAIELTQDEFDRRFRQREADRTLARELAMAACMDPPSDCDVSESDDGDAEPLGSHPVGDGDDDTGGFSMAPSPPLDELLKLSPRQAECERLSVDRSEAGSTASVVVPPTAGERSVSVGVKVVAYNINGLRSKPHVLCAIVNHYQTFSTRMADVFFFLEAKIDTDDTSELTIPAGFSARAFPFGVRNVYAAGGIIVMWLTTTPLQFTEHVIVEGLEAVSVVCRGLPITGYYWCPPKSEPAEKAARLTFKELASSQQLLIGDGNGRSPSYDRKMSEEKRPADHRGKFVELVADSCVMHLLPDVPSVSRVGAGTCPDFALVAPTADAVWELTQFDESDHRPLCVTVGCRQSFSVPETKVTGNTVYYALRKANWEDFRKRLTLLLRHSVPDPPSSPAPPSPAASPAASQRRKRPTMSVGTQSTALVSYLLEAAKHSIPRGKRKVYKPNWTPALAAEARAVKQLWDTARRSGSLVDTEKAAAAESAHADAWQAGRTSTFNENVAAVESPSAAWRIVRGLDPHKPVPEVLSAAPDAGGATQSLPSVREQHEHLERRFLEQARARHPDVGDLDLPPRNAEIIPKVTFDLVLSALEELAPKSSCGPDAIPARLVSEARHVPSFVHALTRLFTAILKQGRIPSEWLRAEVTAIIKGQKSGESVLDYRPIALCAAMCKVLEWCVDRLTRTVYTQSSQQFGFVPTKSSEQVTALLAAEIAEHFANVDGGTAMALFIDFAEAFTSVWPEYFLKQLKHRKIPTYLIRFYRAFLTGRKQRLTWKGYKGAWRGTPWGAPIGTVLGPLIWNIMLHDLLDKFPQVHVFFKTTQRLTPLRWAALADDLTLWVTGKNLHSCQQWLHESAGVVNKWASHVGMRISPKTCAMPFFAKRTPDIDKQLEHLAQSPIMVGTLVVQCNLGGGGGELSLAQRLLGVHFDSTLSFAAHVEMLCGTINSFARVFQFVRNMKLQHQRPLLYGAVVSRALFGCAAFWLRLTDAQRNAIVTAVGKCARLVAGVLPGVPSHVAMRECGILDIPQLVTRHCVKLVEKSVRLPGEDCFLKRLIKRGGGPLLARYVIMPDLAREPLLLSPQWNPSDPVPVVEFRTRSHHGLAAQAPRHARRLANQQLLTYADPNVFGTADGSVNEGVSSAAACAVWVRAADEPLLWQTLNQAPAVSAELPELPHSLAPQFEASIGAGPYACSFRPEQLGLRLLLNCLRVAARDADVAGGVSALGGSDSLSNIMQLAKGPNRQTTYAGAETWKVLGGMGVGTDIRKLVIAFMHSHCGCFAHQVVDVRAGRVAKTAPSYEFVSWQDSARELAKQVPPLGPPPKPHFHDRLLQGGRSVPWRDSAPLQRSDQRLLAQLRTNVTHAVGQHHGASYPNQQRCPWCDTGVCDTSHFYGPCAAITRGLRKYPDINAIFARGIEVLVTHPVSAVLAFKAALRLLNVDRRIWGRDFILPPSLAKTKLHDKE
jgi:hypothetical protein